MALTPKHGLTTQYLIGSMHLKLQNQIDSFGLLIASERDEEYSLI